MLPSNLISQIGATCGEDGILAEEKKTEKVKMTGDKIMISAKVPKELKGQWTELCTKNGLSFSMGIIVAFDVLMECVNRGIVELKPYGANFNKVTVDK